MSRSKNLTNYHDVYKRQAYSKEMFEEEGTYYTSHLWIAGIDDVAFECSFTVRKGEPVSYTHLRTVLSIYPVPIIISPALSLQLVMTRRLSALMVNRNTAS